MKRGLKGLIVTTLISFGITSIPLARAAHATNFLDALHAEITNRIANLDTNSTARDKRVLKSARAILEHNTRTFATDLSALARAAATLDTRFEDDATLHALGSNAVVAYSNEAHAELDDAELHIGTNSIPRGWRQQLARARAGLTNADEITDTPKRARATARVFNQIHQLIPKVLRKFPTIPFEAPATEADIATGKNILLFEDAIVNDQTIFYFHTTAGVDRNLNYEAHSPSPTPEELGLWTYQRTSAKTALLHCAPNFPAGLAAHDMSLTFTSATAGTFSGDNASGEHITGTFTIAD